MSSESVVSQNKLVGSEYDSEQVSGESVGLRENEENNNDNENNVDNI